MASAGEVGPRGKLKVTVVQQKLRVKLTHKSWHLWGISVGYYGEPVVLRDHGDSGNLCPFWHWWLSSLLPVWGGVGPMWWHWVTWCGCPANTR